MKFSKLIRTKIFLLLLVWRVGSIFVVQTSHVPDEYWQSLEVAHKLAFDYGYLTWEWKIGIRSYLYPCLISILYSILKFLKADYVFMLITLPRLFQALLCAYAEYRFYVWTNSKFALFMLCINWYWYYCATRTLINSFETCLTMIALSHYPWKYNLWKTSKFLRILGFLCFVRPTSIVLWLPLCFIHMFQSRIIFIRYLLVGLFYLIISTTVDTICYGRFILTPLEFFKINVVNNISEQYGKMHVMWYLISGIPVVLGINYLLLLFAMIKIYDNYKYFYQPAVLILTADLTISVYSLLAHKEFRFILPILPIFIYVINATTFQKRFSTFQKKAFIALLIITNIIPGVFFSIFHQQGALNVMKELRNDIEIRNPSEVNILFLTTCHATPYYSHLHKNVSMRFLTCEPNLEGVENYYDETDQFFENPMKWLESNYLNKSSISLPSHVIVYDTTVKTIQPFLYYYKEMSVCADTHFSQHGNFSEFIIYKNHSLK